MTVKKEDKAPRTEGIVEMDNSLEFAYHLSEGTTVDGREIDYLHLRKPKMRKLRANNVTISENMSSVMLSNITKASCLRIVCVDGDELATSKKQAAMDELWADDLIEVAQECIQRFFGKKAD
jgi:hypothetical protein